MTLAATWQEQGILPDPVIRMGFRALLRQRLRRERRPAPLAHQEWVSTLIAAMNASPLAVNTAAANAQHYELPTEFFQRVLCRHLEYGNGDWRPLNPDPAPAADPDDNRS